MTFIINPYRYAAAGGGGSDSGPELITRLQLWLNANAITGKSTADEISTWNDDSGNARHATGVVGSVLKPTYRATDGPNSKPSLRMSLESNGQGGYFTLPNFLTGYTSGHGFAVVKIEVEPPSANARCAPAMADWGSAGDEYYPYTGDNVIYDAFGSTARKTTVDPTPALTTWRLYECRTASGAWSNRIDGVQLITPVANTVGWSTTPKIGGTTTGTAKRLYGQIAEIVFYDSVLGTTDYNSLKSYFNTKYAWSI